MQSFMHIFKHFFFTAVSGSIYPPAALQWSPLMTVIILGSSQWPTLRHCGEKYGCTQLSEAGEVGRKRLGGSKRWYLMCVPEQLSPADVL